MAYERKQRIKLLIFLALAIIIFLGSFALGRYGISIADIGHTFLNELGLGNFVVDETKRNVIVNIRMPRILAAILIGAALSTSGAIFQSIFRNPMASPDLLGASSGAGLGAAFGILLGLSSFKITVMSFVLGLVAVSLSYLISSVSRMEKTLSLVLAGIMVGSVFNSLLSVVKLLADPTDTLPSITYWLMGSLASLSYRDLKFAGPFILVALLLVFLLKWRLNLLTMGEEEASSMGVNIKGLRLVMILVASLLTAASVSISGMIGWVGLVIPHFSRLIIGNDYKYLIPLSMILGASYLLIIDNIARTAASMEIPLGILTALVGAPFFIFLLLRGDRK